MEQQTLQSLLGATPAGWLHAAPTSERLVRLAFWSCAENTTCKQGEKLGAAALKSVHMHKAKIVMQVFSISLQNPWGGEKEKRRVNVLGYGSFFLLRFLSFIEKNILLRL